MELAHDLAFLPETLHVRDRLAGLPIKETAAAKGLPIVNPSGSPSEPTGRSPRSHRGCRVDGEEGRQQVDRARPIIVSESIAANEVAESVAN